MKIGTLVALLAMLVCSPSLAGTTAAQYNNDNGSKSPGSVIMTSPDGVNSQAVSTATPLPITAPGGIALAAPDAVSSTDISGTVTTGGSYQTILTASTSRKGCAVQNTSALSEPLLVKVGTMAAPFQLTAGAVFNCAGPGGTILSGAITVSAATTGHAFSGTAQ